MNNLEVTNFLIISKNKENAEQRSVFFCVHKYMLFAGWEVCIVKMLPEAADDPKLVNNIFIFFQALKRKKKLTEKAHASVTVTMVRDRKIRTELRTI